MNSCMDCIYSKKIDGSDLRECRFNPPKIFVVESEKTTIVIPVPIYSGGACGRFKQRLILSVDTNIN